MTVRLLAVVAAVGLALAGACGGGGAEEGERTLRVFAASSLTEAFTALADDFESARPDVAVSTTFAASTALARQLADGATADVVVTADERTMAGIVDAGDARAPVVIARNRLAILVEPGNPKAITGLRDLAGDAVVFVHCAPQVPCGRLAVAAMARVDVKAEPASLEENVKGVVAKVALGEADAGIVYETDARSASAAGRAEAVAIEADLADDPSLQAVYPAAAATSSAHPALAREWLTFLRSPAAQRTLSELGFRRP